MVLKSHDAHRGTYSFPICLLSLNYIYEFWMLFRYFNDLDFLLFWLVFVNKSATHHCNARHLR